MTPIWEQSTSHGEARSLTSRGSHQPVASVLVLRVFDLAPKGRDKSAQGNALGLNEKKRLFNQPQALNGRHDWGCQAMQRSSVKNPIHLFEDGCFALSGRWFSQPAFSSQGVALG
jgi:hypothetical protein